MTHDVVSLKVPCAIRSLDFPTFTAQGIDPDVAHNLAWDPAIVVIDALRHLGTSASAKQIHGYIEAMQRFAGTNGMFDFRDGSERGFGLSSGVIVE